MFGGGDGGGSTAVQVIVRQHLLVASAAFRIVYVKQPTPPALCAGGVSNRTVIWHRAILPGPCGPSIVAAVGLNFRVRNGNGWIPHAIGARNC